MKIALPFVCQGRVSSSTGWGVEIDGTWIGHHEMLDSPDKGEVVVVVDAAPIESLVRHILNTREAETKTLGLKKGD